MEWYWWILVWWLSGVVSLVVAYILDDGGEAFTVRDVLSTILIAWFGVFLWILFAIFAVKDVGWDKKVAKALHNFLDTELYTPKKEKK